MESIYSFANIMVFVSRLFSQCHSVFTGAFNVMGSCEYRSA